MEKDNIQELNADVFDRCVIDFFDPKERVVRRFSGKQIKEFVNKKPKAAKPKAKVEPKPKEKVEVKKKAKPRADLQLDKD